MPSQAQIDPSTGARFECIDTAEAAWPVIRFEPHKSRRRDGQTQGARGEGSHRAGARPSKAPYFMALQFRTVKMSMAYGSSVSLQSVAFNPLSGSGRRPNRLLKRLQDDPAAQVRACYAGHCF